MAPTAAALLAAWEAGAARPRLDRAPSLLGSLHRVDPPRAIAELTVGECDRLLGALYAELFGDEVEMVATCPGCGGEVEVGLSVAELMPSAEAEPPATVALQCGGLSISCRVPRNGDLEAISRLGPGGELSDLIERCLLVAHAEDGRPVSAHELSAETAGAVAQALADGDPGAHIPLGIRCPCGAEWVDAFDIRGVVWSELTDWVSATLTTVHQLARSYGWSESEILAMSGWRRRWYMEAAGW